MEENSEPTAPKGPHQEENAFLNLIINLILPVILLKKLTDKIGPNYALLIALAFPILYFIYDYIKFNKKNLLSILGFVNILMTGGLALLNVSGFWFAVKEAAFPLVIGIGVYFSKWTQKPVMKMFIFNEKFMNTEKIENIVKEKNQYREFETHFKKSTVFLAYSFFLSALLNFLLARWIFKDIDPTLSEVAQKSILNDQIAKMYWVSFIVIALPLTLFMLGIGWHLNNGLKKLTGLSTEELFPFLVPPPAKSKGKIRPHTDG